MLVELKSKKLKVRNLPERDYKLGDIQSKPYGFIIFFLLLGIYIAYRSNLLFGILLIGIFLYYLLVNKNQVMTEFYEDFVVFYNERDPQECYIVFWDEIASWTYERGRFDTDRVHVSLKNGEKIVFRSLSPMKMKKYFHQKAGKAEVRKSKVHA